MNERFIVLQKAKENMYKDGAPIIVSAAVLLKDTITENIITQIKFLSVTDARIKALKVTINAFDITGKAVAGIDEYQYLDLDVKNGDYFGSNKAIVMPDSNARSIQIDKISVIFDEREYFISGEDLSPLESQALLSSELKQPEIVKQYQIDTTPQAKYIPKDTRGLWLCSCGTPNARAICAHCGASKETIFSAFNTQILTAHMQARLTEQAKADKLIRQKEEAAAAILSKKKRTYKLMGLTAILLVVAIVVGSVIVQNIKEKKQYLSEIAAIEAYISDEEYELAFDQIRNSNLEYSEKESYYEIVIPHMRAARNAIKDSTKENLAVVIDGVEIYVADYDIYRVEKDGSKTILYTVPDYISLAGFTGYSYLNPRRSMYANGYLFFVECEKSRSSSGKAYYDYTARYVDIETGKVETIANGESFSDIVKLDDGTIFVGFDLLHPNDGIVFNPYTGSSYENEDAVSDRELEDAIYY